jgi:hypothetical protein
MASHITNSFETLREMRYHSLGVPCFGQDVQKFIIRQKVKARENCSFGLQVVVESFLNTLKSFVCFCKAGEKILIIHHNKCEGVAEHFGHGDAEHFVDGSEFPGGQSGMARDPAKQMKMKVRRE